MRSKLTFSGAALALFTAESGDNLRVRTQGGLSVLPTTRPRGVPGELFGTKDGHSVVVDSELAAGHYSLLKAKYGWETLVANGTEGAVTGIHITHVE